MKRMNALRIFALLLSVLTLLPLLSSCHGAKKSHDFDLPEQFDESKSYEITFWAKNDTNVTQTRIYEKAIADFEALYPNVKVKLKLYTDYGKIYNDVITNIPTATTPNVCITYPDHIATYMTGENTVVPLDSLFADPKYGLGGSDLRFDGPTFEELVPKFIGECKIGGGYYALPYMRSTEACYINVDLVEKLGYTLPEKLTWDFIFEVSAAAMEKDAAGNFKVNGQKVMIPFIYKSTDNMMIQMLKQKDAGYSTADGQILIFNDTTKELLEMVKNPAGARAFSTFKISSYPGNFLNKGQCIFAIDSTAGATWMGSDAPLSDIHESEKYDFETKVMTIPQFDVDNPKMISQGPSVCVFNKEDSGEVLASWLFTQYLLTNEVQIAYAQTEGYVPVTLKAQQSEEYQSYLAAAGSDNDLHYSVKMDATKLLLDNTANTFVTPVFNGSASLRSAAGQLIEDVAKRMRRGEKVDYEEIFKEVSALYRLDQIEKGDGKRELGALPDGSKWLIGTLIVIWLAIGGYVIFEKCKKFKKKDLTS